jgi:hypothetical protein
VVSLLWCSLLLAWVTLPCLLLTLFKGLAILDQEEHVEHKV